MAVRKIDNITLNSPEPYQGLSTDTKPTLTEQDSGSTFYCVDTSDCYVWHIDQWYPL